MKKVTLLLFFLATTAVITASTPSVVISGVYGGGGNTNAPALNDYIELYNTTASPIDMSGWAIYYTSATGTSFASNSAFTFPSGTSIGANGFLLLQASKGTGTQTNPYEFDIDISGSGGTNFSIAATAGKVLLLSQYTNLTATGSIPTTLAGIQALAGFVDYVPFGSSSTPPVGTSMANLSATTAATRIITGTTVSYTPDMAADFSVVTLTASVPRNSKTNLSIPAVATPTFSVPTGTYSVPQSVTIATATVGASIYYTTDGSDPTESSTLYTAPITVSTTTTIKAIAIQAGMDNSAIASATYALPEISGNEGIIYQTGFESSEGFAASQTYNNPAMAFTGPANAQWGTIFGTPTATASLIISGAQSMQMRWYTNNPGIFGSTETRFDLPNVTKVTFKAKNTLLGGIGMNLTALYSTDGGTSWQGGQVFTLGTSAADFTYNISATGEYPNVRIKFLVTQSGATLPSGTNVNVQVTIDDVVVYYVMTGLVIGPTETKTASDYINGGYADIVIQSDDNSTGQLDLQGENLTVNGVVKFEKTFAQKEWYAVGFPFDVASVNVNYEGADYKLWTYDGAGATGDDGKSSGDYWLKTYDGAADVFNFYNNSVGSATIAQGGYILEVPSTLVGLPIVFTSGSGITLTGSTAFPALPASGYLLTNSPSYANFDVQSAYPATTGNNYYTYGTYGATNFGLNHNQYALKPFESLVVENNSSYGLRSTLGGDAVTGLPALNLPNDKVVATEYYNLMGVKTAQPAKRNIYVVKTLFESGKTSVVKQFIDK